MSPFDVGDHRRSSTTSIQDGKPYPFLRSRTMSTESQKQTNFGAPIAGSSEGFLRSSIGDMTDLMGRGRSTSINSGMELYAALPSTLSPPMESRSVFGTVPELAKTEPNTTWTNKLRNFFLSSSSSSSSSSSAKVEGLSEPLLSSLTPVILEDAPTAAVQIGGPTDEMDVNGIVATPGLSTAPRGNAMLRAYQRYEQCLAEQPLFTKSVTAAAVSAMGDLLAQFLEGHGGGESADAAISGEMEHSPGIHMARLLTFALAGGLYVGPYCHYFYEQLWILGRWLEKTYHLPRPYQIFLQVLIDQSIGVFIFFPTYFFVYEFIEGPVTFRVPAVALVLSKLRNELMVVIAMQYRLWPLANTINFSVVPERFRVLFANIVAVFWNAFLCARLAKK